MSAACWGSGIFSLQVLIPVKSTVPPQLFLTPLVALEVQKLETPPAATDRCNCSWEVKTSSFPGFCGSWDEFLLVVCFFFFCFAAVPTPTKSSRCGTDPQNCCSGRSVTPLPSTCGAVGESCCAFPGSGTSSWAFPRQLLPDLSQFSQLDLSQPRRKLGWDRNTSARDRSVSPHSNRLGKAPRIEVFLGFWDEKG